MTVTAQLEAPSPTTIGQVYLFSKAEKPVLERRDLKGRAFHTAFRAIGEGRSANEQLWLAEPELPTVGNWHFRIVLAEGVFNAPVDATHYITGLHELWLQDKQIYAYRPAPHTSPSRVIKIPHFEGSLPKRSLFVYLPRGYSEHIDKRYPVLYMHDGQNCFETFVEDSYAGSWRADKVADTCINAGQMRECIIVGVSNGQQARLKEYLPPYSSFSPKQQKLKTKDKEQIRANLRAAKGRADETFRYYRDEVAPYIAKHYRSLTGRNDTATCGSSMGGLFSTYIAWEHTGFARHHAFMSPSYWITRNSEGHFETIKRLREDAPRDIRIWLDSGTGEPDSNSNDNMDVTRAARDALLANGYVMGQDFQYYLHEGAGHHESAWAARLPKVFSFLFPPMREG